MRWFSVLLFVASCTAPAPDRTGITRACVRSFAPTLAAWQDALGRVPDACAVLDAEYDVQLVGDMELPCLVGEGEFVVGCTVPEAQTIFLLRGRDHVALVDTSVHEWIHALADCVDGDADREHLRAELWALGSAESVEIQAQASAVIGECL